MNAKPLTSRKCEPSISDDHSTSSESDSELSNNNNDEYLSEDEQGHLGTSKHSRWSELDEQRLLAWKKEDKAWDWIFSKFRHRTPAAVRTRWSIVQRKRK